MTKPELIPLVDGQHLNLACIKLLNQEWPRSDGSREHSQKKSCRASPPMSLLYILKNEAGAEELVGHVRICKLPNREKACWVESLIVSQEKRGTGLGRALMDDTELFVRRFGFDEVFLCTEDKQGFYERCGYVVCEPILHSTAATSVFPLINNLALEKS
ncbi:unnamed protein product, partial [Mesorhabditis spiculigera]